MKFIAIRDLYFLIVIGLVKVVGLVSSSKLKEFVISSIVFFSYRFSRKKRQIMEKNITVAFNGKLSEIQRREIVRGAFLTFWQYMFSWLPSNVDGEEVMGAEVHGLEHLQQALSNGKGVILWESKGLGKRIPAKRILRENGFLIHQVHGANNLGGFLVENGFETWVRRSVINRFFENCERQFVKDIINLPRSNSLAFTRTLLSRLKQNAVLCITGDGKTGQKLIALKFLGQTDLFSTGMVSLSKISGAEILPIFCLRERKGKTIFVIEKPIQIEGHENREYRLENSVSEYIALLEMYIKQYPEQYRDWHLSGELFR